jgi:hypothetical protein
MQIEITPVAIGTGVNANALTPKAPAIAPKAVALCLKATAIILIAVAFRQSTDDLAPSLNQITITISWFSSKTRCFA